jgi:DNA-binding beta-propeller fold protein YncE
VRRVRGILGGSAILVLLALPGGVGERPLPLHSQPSATATLSALVGDSGGSRLVQVNPSTLATVRASARVGYYDGWVRAPDGKLLVIATHRASSSAQTSRIRFVNSSTLKFVRKGVALDGYFRAAIWPSAGRLLTVAGNCCNSGVELDTIDTVAKRITARRAIAGAVTSIDRSRDGLVLLAAPPDEIGAARLVVVGPDASVRSVTLDRIRAGSHYPQESSQDPIGTIRQPGLAVDPAGGVAYVVDPDGLIAAVRLADMSVTYRTPSAPRSLLGRLARWLTPTASAKGLNGPIRTAEWIGDGMLAITGSDASAVKQKDGTTTFSSRAVGLAIVDTRDWTIRTLDAEADSATIADGLLLATGGTWRSDGSTNTSTGEGLTAWGPDGSLRWRLFPGTQPWVLAAVGERAVVQQAGLQSFVLVDLATGKVMRSLGGTYQWLLLGTGSAD